MLPAIFDLVGDDWAIYQGDTYKLPLRLKDAASSAYLDLTSVTIKSQIRARVGSPEVLAEFEVIPATDQVADRGRVIMRLDESVTALIPAGDAVWDLQVDIDGDIRTLLKGSVKVEGEVTV